jgi:hypothetical protein
MVPKIVPGSSRSSYDPPPTSSERFVSVQLRAWDTVFSLLPERPAFLTLGGVK